MFTFFFVSLNHAQTTIDEIATGAVEESAAKASELIESAAAEAVGATEERMEAVGEDASEALDAATAKAEDAGEKATDAVEAVSEKVH